MSAAEKPDSDSAPVQWQLLGDQYELFPVPPGPANAFRAMLGQSEPTPELLAGLTAPEVHQGIFPELALSLRMKLPPPPGMVDSGQLAKMQDVLSPSVDKLAAMLTPYDSDPFAPLPEFEPEAPQRVVPNFGDSSD